MAHDTSPGHLALVTSNDKHRLWAIQLSFYVQCNAVLTKKEDNWLVLSSTVAETAGFIQPREKKAQERPYHHF